MKLYHRRDEGNLAKGRIEFASTVGSIVEILMADKKVQFGATSKGKQSVIHKQYEFVKHREYANRTIQWRCRLYPKSRCYARLTTKGHDIVSELSHGSNKESASAPLAVNEMKEKMGELSATPTAAIGSVSTQLYT